MLVRQSGSGRSRNIVAPNRLDGAQGPFTAPKWNKNGPDGQLLRRLMVSREILPSDTYQVAMEKWQEFQKYQAPSFKGAFHRMALEVGLRNNPDAAVSTQEPSVASTAYPDLNDDDDADDDTHHGGDKKRSADSQNTVTPTGSAKRDKTMDQPVFLPQVAITDYQDQHLNTHLAVMINLPSGTVHPIGSDSLAIDRYRMELVSLGETANQIRLEAEWPTMMTNLPALFTIRNFKQTADDIEVLKCFEKHYRKLRANPDESITSKALIDLPMPVPRQKLDPEIIYDDATGAAILFVDIMALENKDYKSCKVKICRARKVAAPTKSDC
ncbi:hypothetical protein MPSEU_000171000 [Mayamaea pseudoterrestris]|nr:hypothetical protein MPSEU_000171000 [Mayamaea pseudoterrestris]